MSNLQEKLEQFRKLAKEWEAASKIDIDEIGGARAYRAAHDNYNAYAANNALPALEQAMAEIERLRGAVDDCLVALYVMQGDTEDLKLRDEAIKAGEKALSETTE